MNILVWSRTFHPLPGGVSSVAESLNDVFLAEGHRVRVLTWAGAEEYGQAARADYGYPVERQPGFAAQVRAARWADVVLVHYPSAGAVRPLLAAPRPMVVTAHSWLAPGWVGRVQRAILRRSFPVAISRAVAASLGVPSTLIPSPYDPAVFRLRPEVPRDRDVVFCGLLKPFKGCFVVLQAVAGLRDAGRPVRVTFAGGSTAGEEKAMAAEADRLGLTDRVTFLGMCPKEVVARELCGHRVAVAPATWEEPFGIVALEALACGCRVIVSRSGGLPEAVGPHGVVVPRGDPAALATAIAAALDRPPADPTAERAEHLRAHAAPAIGRRYLAVLEAARRAGPFRHGTLAGES